MDRGSTRWPLYVLATTRRGTRCALRVARRLTNGIDGRIILLVPRPASLAAPSDPAGGERAAIIDQHRAIAADVGVRVTVLLCVCRRLEDAIHQLLDRSSLLMVGGRRFPWWPSPEQRLTERLIRAGYAVVFADIEAERPRAVSAAALA